eukprot:scaffold20662_cov66-Phaeocystis_antarctica.AAC.18
MGTHSTRRGSQTESHSTGPLPPSTRARPGRVRSYLHRPRRRTGGRSCPGWAHTTENRSCSQQRFPCASFQQGETLPRACHRFPAQGRLMTTLCLVQSRANTQALEAARLVAAWRAVARRAAARRA